eukprot:EG_transcript_15573
MPLLEDRSWDTGDRDVELRLSTKSGQFLPETVPRELSWADRHDLQVELALPAKFRSAPLLAQLTMTDANDGVVELGGQCQAPLAVSEKAARFVAHLWLDFPMACHPQYHPPHTAYTLHLTVTSGDTVIAACHSPSFRIRIATAPATAPTKRARPVAGGSQQKGLEDVWAHVLRLDYPSQVSLLTRLSALVRAKQNARLLFCIPFLRETAEDLRQAEQLRASGDSPDDDDAEQQPGSTARKAKRGRKRRAKGSSSSSSEAGGGSATALVDDDGDSSADSNAPSLPPSRPTRAPRRLPRHSTLYDIARKRLEEEAERYHRGVGRRAKKEQCAANGAPAESPVPQPQEQQSPDTDGGSASSSGSAVMTRARARRRQRKLR